MFPHNEEVERGYLSMMLLSGENFAKVDAQASLFYIPAHSIIYNAISPDQPNDFASVCYRLGSQLDEVGGKNTVSELYDSHSAFDPSITDYYRSTLLNLADLRNSIVLARQIEETAAAPNSSMDDVLLLSSRITKSSTAQKGVVLATELANDFNQWLEQLHTGEVDDRGVLWGIDGLPSIVDRLRPGELCLIGGYPGSGKTSLANSTVALSCVPLKKPALIFSLEMPARQETMRLASIVGRIPLKRLMIKGELLEADYPKLAAATTAIHDAKLGIVDTVMSISEISAAAGEFKKQNGLDLVVIDYAGLVRVSGKDNVMELGDVGKVAKWLAKDCDCAVMLLTQLTGDEPYGAKALKAHCDQFLIVRDHKNNARLKQIEVVKQRNGPRGTVSCSFHPEAAAFYNGGL